MRVRRAPQSFALACVSHRAVRVRLAAPFARVRLAAPFARAPAARHCALAEPSASCAPWQRALGSRVATVRQSWLPLHSPLGQSVAGASHRRAAPRSQWVSGLVSLRRRLLAPAVPPSSQVPAPSAFEGQLPFVAKSRFVWHPQPNPAFERTATGVPASAAQGKR
jgi:hypothetical protein